METQLKSDKGRESEITPTTTHWQHSWRHHCCPAAHQTVGLPCCGDRKCDSAPIVVWLKTKSIGTPNLIEMAPVHL